MRYISTVFAYDLSNNQQFRDILYETVASAFPPVRKLSSSPTRDRLTSRIHLASDVFLRPAATGRVCRLMGDLSSQHARSCRSTLHQQQAMYTAHRHLRVCIICDAMLSENRQQLLFAFPGKQVVLSLQHARLDISCQSQIMLQHH